jgi:hypothetical protein
LPIAGVQRQRWRSANNKVLYEHLRVWHTNDKLAAYNL